MANASKSNLASEDDPHQDLLAAADFRILRPPDPGTTIFADRYPLAVSYGWGIGATSASIFADTYTLPARRQAV